MTLDPGHFHAGLVHKYMYDGVDPTVHIYAPDGPDIDNHLALIERFNSRTERPTHWKPVVYRGQDYLARMLAEKPGNVMVVSGNNGRKIKYIQSAVAAGINVLADKPLIIRPSDFDVLRETMDRATEKGLLVYDIMTERHEITSILQRELSQNRDLFGELISDSPDEPAITKESVHFFSKNIAGRPLIRPTWFFDTKQQGEAIVDVSTHLVDLIMWQLFPGEAIDYENPSDGVHVLSARSWSSSLTPAQFETVTGEATYPEFLAPDVDSDSILSVAANGEFVFTVRGVTGKVSVEWGFENPEGGDTHYSVMRGTKANLVVRQNSPQAFRATLYVEPSRRLDSKDLRFELERALRALDDRYSGLTAESTEFGWEIKIPDRYKEGHEEHFTRVTEQFLDHLAAGVIPEWERANLLTKYFITTRAYEKSRK
jgi:predicted dehydrogenase